MPPNDIALALSQEISVRTQALISKPEDQWFERKSFNVTPKDLARTLISFANAEGGSVIVGIQDRTVQHLADYQNAVNTLRKVSTSEHCTPSLTCTVDEVEVHDADGKPCTLLLFTVPPASRSLYRASDGTCYVRYGDSSMKIDRRQERELEYERGVQNFEAEPTALTMKDLNSECLENFEASTGSSRGIEHLLLSRGLADRDPASDTLRANKAACLLFANYPDTIVPNATIRVLRYAGSERRTGQRQNIVFDQRTDTPIPEAIIQAITWTAENMPERKALGESSLFQRTPLIPKAAWEEGIINAAIHRSYSYSGDYVRVEIFDDRIEISNPGHFNIAASGPFDALKVPRYVRNPRIARTCTDLGFSQELGEGIKRIYEEMAFAGLTDPIYEQTSTHVRLTLPFIARLSDDQRKALPSSSERVLQTLRQLGGQAGTSEIAAAANISAPTTRKVLASLRDEGLIRWEGKSMKDPRASWVLVLH